MQNAAAQRIVNPPRGCDRDKKSPELHEVETLSVRARDAAARPGRCRKTNEPLRNEQIKSAPANQLGDAIYVSFFAVFCCALALVRQSCAADYVGLSSGCVAGYPIDRRIVADDVVVLVFRPP